jgi:hypothetical protein
MNQGAPMNAAAPIPAAFQVALAEHPGKTLERCSCGCLKPKGETCPYARREA